MTLTKNALFIFLFLLSIDVRAQPKTYDIEINIVGTTIKNWQLIIHIFKNEENIKVVYSTLDSVDHAAVRKDTIWQKSSGDQKKRIEIMKKYYVFTKDSIAISNKLYADFLDSIYITDQKSLIRLEQNKGRGMLDGVGVRILQKTGNTIDRVINVETPWKDSHPEIYRLITYTISLYREKFPDSFLTERVTFGY
jgi:hypothetical protein